ncbi:MAG: hypothetical protein IPM13_04825 [Phycisphaerales bacterium]|nr:hypothetical protein [Phycisphaerales bacterium]
MDALKPILDLLKSHWITLVSGVVALGAVVILVLGMMRTNVVEEMNRHKALAGEISSLMSGAKHEGMITAEKERGTKFDEQYRAALETARSINKRDPLLPGVFPRPASQAVAFQFQDAYKQRFLMLPRELQGGGPPTQQEIQDEAERLAEEIRRKKGELSLDLPPGPLPPPAPPAPGADPREPPPSPAMGPGQATATGVPAGLAEQNAAVRTARSIRMYVEATGSRAAFQISPIIASLEAPSARDMWYAQVGLWIQEDVVRALAGLNAEAAARLKAEDAHVGNMPVKHLLGIRVLGYLTKTGQLVRLDAMRSDTSGPGQPVIAAGTPMPGELKPSFTGRTSDDQFDVVRFSVQLIADQRDLLRVADAITRANFYQLVSLNYDAGPVGGQDGPYLYGDAPVVRATYDFEGFMARKAYEELMPEDVRKDLGIVTAGP